MDFIKGVLDQANYLQAAVAALAPFLLGWIWYNKAVFGKIWMADSGMTEEKARSGNMALIFGLTLVLNFVVGIYLSQFAGIGAWNGVQWGLMIGIWVVIPIRGVSYLFNQKTFRLWVIDALYDLVSLAAMGLIIGVWKP